MVIVVVVVVVVVVIVVVEVIKVVREYVFFKMGVCIYTYIYIFFGWIRSNCGGSSSFLGKTYWILQDSGSGYCYLIKLGYIVR